MDLTIFLSSIERDTAPPADSTLLLQALWWDARGDWAQAHELCQQQDNADGAWVHAYLHRKEGDLANAAYWYRRAAKPLASGPLADEWRHLAETLLGQ
jgi:hypothetical protein